MLASSFIQYVRVRCLIQADVHIETRPRIHPAKHTLRIQDPVSITSEDDGGICQMLLVPGSTWSPDNQYLAILEAKRTFNLIDE